MAVSCGGDDSGEVGSKVGADWGLYARAGGAAEEEEGEGRGGGSDADMGTKLSVTEVREEAVGRSPSFFMTRVTYRRLISQSVSGIRPLNILISEQQAVNQLVNSRWMYRGKSSTIVVLISE